jgi:hypothetical protein
MHNELWHLITEFIEKEILYLFLKKSRFFQKKETCPEFPVTALTVNKKPDRPLKAIRFSSRLIYKGVLRITKIMRF